MDVVDGARGRGALIAAVRVGDRPLARDVNVELCARLRVVRVGRVAHFDLIAAACAAAIRQDIRRIAEVLPLRRIRVAHAIVVNGVASRRRLVDLREGEAGDARHAHLLDRAGARRYVVPAIVAPIVLPLRVALRHAVGAGRAVEVVHREVPIHLRDDRPVVREARVHCAPLRIRRSRRVQPLAVPLELSHIRTRGADAKRVAARAAVVALDHGRSQGRAAARPRCEARRHARAVNARARVGTGARVGPREWARDAQRPELRAGRVEAARALCEQPQAERARSVALGVEILDVDGRRLADDAVEHWVARDVRRRVGNLQVERHGEERRDAARQLPRLRSRIEHKKHWRQGLRARWDRGAIVRMVDAVAGDRGRRRCVRRGNRRVGFAREPIAPRLAQLDRQQLAIDVWARHARVDAAAEQLEVREVDDLVVARRVRAAAERRRLVGDAAAGHRREHSCDLRPREQRRARGERVARLAAGAKRGGAARAAKGALQAVVALRGLRRERAARRLAEAGRPVDGARARRRPVRRILRRPVVRIDAEHTRNGAGRAKRLPRNRRVLRAVEDAPVEDAPVVIRRVVRVPARPGDGCDLRAVDLLQLVAHQVGGLLVVGDALVRVAAAHAAVLPPRLVDQSL